MYDLPGKDRAELENYPPLDFIFEEYSGDVNDNALVVIPHNELIIGTHLTTWPRLRYQEWLWSQSKLIEIYDKLNEVFNPVIDRTDRFYQYLEAFNRVPPHRITEAAFISAATDHGIIQTIC